MKTSKPNHLYEAVLELNTKYDFIVENYYIKVVNSTNSLPITESIIPHLHAVDVILFDDDEIKSFATEAYQIGLLTTTCGAYIRLTTNDLALDANSQDDNFI
jgi:hypothetical protein